MKKIIKILKEIVSVVAWLSNPVQIVIDIETVAEIRQREKQKKLRNKT